MMANGTWQMAEGTFVGLAPEEVELFRRVLAGVKGEGVEIGCMDGYSTAHILACSDLGLVSIDPFVPDSMRPELCGSILRFEANVAPWKDRSRLIVNHSWNIAPSWVSFLDFLFIDGDHREHVVDLDFIQWACMLRPGGILAMHDARIGRPGGAPWHPGPSKVAQKRVFGKPEEWEIIGEAVSLVIARKK